VLNKVALERIQTEYFGFVTPVSFHRGSILVYDCRHELIQQAHLRPGTELSVGTVKKGPPIVATNNATYFTTLVIGISGTTTTTTTTTGTTTTIITTTITTTTTTTNVCFLKPFNDIVHN